MHLTKGKLFHQLETNSSAWIILLWILATCINWNKAFHIDDTFYLNASQWVIAHPLQPMSGSILWTDVPKPLHFFNQPPLYMYAIGILGSAFGYTEWIMHTWVSVFTGLSIFFFYKLLCILQVATKWLYLILFVLSPAYLVNQNVMLDMPTLAVLLGILYFTILAGERNFLKNYVIANIFFGGGILIKYALLPLFIVIPLVMLLRGHLKYLWTFFIPIGIIYLWSVWNINEFGYAHILGRGGELIYLKVRTVQFFMCLGAVTWMGIPLIAGGWNWKWVRWLLYLFSFIPLVLIFLYRVEMENNIRLMLNFWFIFQGLGIIIGFFAVFYFNRIHLFKRFFLRSPLGIIFIFLIGISVFLICFAPATATRYVLLVLPICLLAGHQIIDQAKPVFYFTGIMQSIFAIWIALSDWQTADFYRDMAQRIPIKPGITYWTNGFWGWQWYTNQKGIQSWHEQIQTVQPGDYFLIPGGVNQTHLPAYIRLEYLNYYTKPASLTTYLNVTPASMYTSDLYHGPWYISKSAIDTIKEYQVLAVD